MKHRYTYIAGITVLLCVHVSQANISYYVRNDTLVPLMVGLYSIDENGRVINPDNYTFLLAPQSLASQGQSAHLTSLTSSHEVGKRFIFSQSPHDMAQKVVYDIDHPWVFVRPIEHDENKTRQRYYHIYADIFSHEAQGHNLIIEPLEHPIVGNQSTLKFNLKKEAERARLNQAIRKTIEQNKEAVKERKEEKQKAVEALRKQLQEKVDVIQTRNKLQELLRTLKQKIQAFFRSSRPEMNLPSVSPVLTPQTTPSSQPVQSAADESLVIHRQEKPIEESPVVFHYEIPIAPRVEPRDVDLVPGPEEQEAEAVLAHAKALAAADPAKAAKLDPLIKKVEIANNELSELGKRRESEHRERRRSSVIDVKQNKINKRRVSVVHRLPEDPEVVRQKEQEAEKGIEAFMSGKDPFENAGFEDLSQ